MCFDLMLKSILQSALLGLTFDCSPTGKKTTYMIEIQGRYNTAICYTDILGSAAFAQILEVCNIEAFAQNTIRIMPDVHAGKGCTIGTTMTITDKIVPGMVGVDIGCGMETIRLSDKVLDLDALDAAIRSIGTLGGGNHFIEVDRDDEGYLYLVIHSGSRHLGCEVADYYQEEGYRALCGNAHYQLDEVIATLKAQGRTGEIQPTIQALKKKRSMNTSMSRDLAYVEGILFDNYIHDMKIVQHFATLNRRAMAYEIMTALGLEEAERFTTIHNYIDTDAMILRKGAVSARAGEKLLIPINMRDGSLICIGKGNTDWNCSAPHGAGRLMSRGTARAQLSMEEYEMEMEGIYTTCVGPHTLDESPMAYKPMDEIIAQIHPTAHILARIKPIYNFKA